MMSTPSDDIKGVINTLSIRFHELRVIVTKKESLCAKSDHFGKPAKAFCFYLINNNPIGSQFCTCHDSSCGNIVAQSDNYNLNQSKIPF